MRVLDTSNLDNAINLEKLKLQAALTSNVNFTGEDVPARNIFREFVSIPFSASETLGFSFTKPENVYLGFIAGNVNIDTQRVNFRPWMARAFSISPPTMSFASLKVSFLPAST